MNQSQSERHESASSAMGELGLPEIDPKAALAAVTDFTRDNPHVALGGALAVGFLLGGGLTPRILGAIGLVAARRYFATALRDTLESVVQEPRA